jgi:SPOR domain
MLLRLLFVLLIALNIAVAAWLLLGDDGAHVSETTDKGVPRLQLLAEVQQKPVAAATVEAAKTSSVTTPAAPTTVKPAPAESLAPAVATAPAPPVPSTRRTYRCYALGPFATQADLRSARSLLAPKVARLRARSEQTSQSRGWRVYLPALSTRDAALAEAKRLSAKGVEDYFVVTAGDQQNTVALGLFHDPANARKRRDEVAAQGFPAKMSERTENAEVYWLDLVVDDAAGNSWRDKVSTPGMTTKPTGCF